MTPGRHQIYPKKTTTFHQNDPQMTPRTTPNDPMDDPLGHLGPIRRYVRTSWYLKRPFGDLGKGNRPMPKTDCH